MNDLPTCWAAVAHTLAAGGVRHVFGLPSDEPGLLDAASAVPGLGVTVIGDQRTAACAATGYALTAREPTVLALNSGPGFANALPGLLEASSLAVPLVVITTAVPKENIGRGAFQYVDQLSMIRDLAGWTHRVDDPGQLTWAVRQAIHRALNGRPDLTALEITDELTRTNQPPPPVIRPVRRLRTLPSPADLDEAAETLRTAHRPLIVAGGGTRWPHDIEGVEELADLLEAPVFTTAAGRGAVDERHPRAFGLLGLYTTPPATDLLETADTLLLLGTRLEETARMGWTNWRTATVVQADTSPAAFGEGSPTVTHPLLGDAQSVVQELTRRLTVAPGTTKAAWSAAQHRVSAAQHATTEPDFDRSPVRSTLHRISRVLGPHTLLVQENGLHDIWTYHYPVLTVAHGARPVCPGEQTMMGFGLGASIGAALARPGEPVVLVTGDSALRLSVGALDALHHHALGVIVVVLDNEGFGWPRRLRAGTPGPHIPTTWRSTPADDLARAFGGHGITAPDEETLTAALREARSRSRSGKFTLIRVQVPDDDVPAGIESSGY